MTDLTEQWKKRTLRNGAFYIKTLGGDILPAFCNTEYILKQFQTMKGIYSDVAEVLAPVPSYEEWQASEKYNKHLEEVIKVYERKDKQATETSIAYNELLEENAQLKELLKDARNVLKMVDTYYGDYDSTKGFLIVERIKEVLK